MIYKTAAEIAPVLGLDERGISEMNRVLDVFPMRIPDYYLSLIDPDDPDDPIRKMCVPSPDELLQCGSFDTSGEAQNTVLPGLQHKYRETALILSTSECAMYCRHCFRKRLVGLSEKEIAADLDQITAYIRAHQEINNVLISGGDAFMMSDERIGRYLQELCTISHLDFIRFGTRTPVVIPQRITGDDTLLAMLAYAQTKKQLVIVTQFNHPNELTAESRAAVKALRRCGAVVRNQTVLMRGINDDPMVLAALLRSLVSIGVMPYYIFQCRPVTGVQNRFQLPIAEGARIVEEAKAAQCGQGKCLKYCMSHPTGKIEILGPGENGVMLFKYHQAKEREDLGRIFSAELNEGQCWL